MSLFAAIRPDDVNFVLFLHVAGAMILVGGLLAGAVALATARGDVALTRIGYRTLLLVAFPGWILMRVAGQLTYNEEGWDDLPDAISEPSWIGLGYIVGDLGGVLLLVALILGAFGVRRVPNGGGSGLMRATQVLALLLLLAFVVAAWAMSAKPS